MIHLDLFSGIGGFAYAVDQVWPDAEHIFCDNDKFCQQVLKKHWPNSKIYGDIKELTGLQVFATFKAYETRISRSPQNVSTRSVNSADSLILQSQPPVNVDVVEAKGMQVSSEFAIQGSKPFLSGNESRRQSTEFIGKSDRKRNRSTENSLRTMQRHGNIQGRQNKNSGTSSRLQQTSESDVAMPKMPSQMAQTEQGNYEKIDYETIDILTAGVPCQPASQAGRRKGKEDDRWLWPETFRIIRETKPRFVILENVRGILTLESGLVFKELLAEMESCGYETRSYIIPAVSVNAPHRRDRVWIIANCTCRRKWSSEPKRNSRRQPEMSSGNRDSNASDPRCKRQAEQQKQAERSKQHNLNASDSTSKRLCGNSTGEKLLDETFGTPVRVGLQREDWNENWLKVATKLCGVDDGLPAGLDFAGWTESRHRVERLKSLGNSIVPAVAIQIMKAINSMPLS